MPLVRAYSVDFSPSGGMPLFSCRGDGPNRETPVYVQHDRFQAAWGWYSRARSELWPDNNHSQRTRLYLPAICFANGVGAGLVDQSKTMPNNLDLNGAELRTEVLCNVLHLPKNVQIVTLAQWFDTEAFDGRGTNVNYINVAGPTVCEALGYPSPYERSPAGLERSSGWVSHVTKFDATEGWIPIDARPDKVAAEVYGRSESIEVAMKSRLLNIMHVFHCGPDAPAVQPMTRALGGLGELYYRKWELWVDTARNPGVVTV